MKTTKPQKLGLLHPAFEDGSEAGRVVRAAAGAFVVAPGATEIEARRAVSCMVEPMAGDMVLVSVLPERGAYILERQGSDVSVVLEGDLHVKLPSGRFVVGAAEGVTFASGKEVAAVAAEVKVNARHGGVFVESLSYLGTTVQADRTAQGCAWCRASEGADAGAMSSRLYGTPKNRDAIAHVHVAL
ncbi:DUF3540 domain-containing protein [Sorangium sp. So ce1099]|uniref:DUF3540 domain-containing protein n=1 Tax=Sorangium sp. So ce1099 TaxID=3133331 RepID=UPI003F5EBAC5